MARNPILQYGDYTMMKIFNWKAAFVTAVCSVMMAGSSYAGELSLLNGLYRSQANDAGFDVSQIQLGGRYLTGLNNKMDIYFQGDLQIVNFSGNNAPDGVSGMGLEVGVRHNLDNFSGRIIPYISGGVGLELGKPKDNNFNPVTERTGITYNGKIGFKTRLGGQFFVDLETALFNSDLFVTEKTGNAEVKRTDIFVSSSARNVFDNATLALGIYL